MKGLLLSSNRDKLVSIALQKRCEPFSVEVFTSEHTDQLVLRLSYKPHPTNWQMGLSNATLLHMNSEQEMIDTCFHMVDEIKKQAYEELYKKYGEYPDVRLWAMDHGGAGLGPGQAIPGWVWPRVNAKYPSKKFLKGGGIVDKNVLTELDIDENGREVAPVAAKRTVKVVKSGPKGKKVTVSKPHCKVHTSIEMKFSLVRNLWECPETDCNMVARPKNDNEAGTVRIGQGEVELRLVYTGEPNSPRVILMSDDNVVLDITEYVDIENLKTTFDVPSAVRTARSQGVEVTRVAHKPVPVRMSLVILGVNDYQP